MKKYNKPEIETLALEMVDVIETSGSGATALKLQSDEAFASYAGTKNVQTINESIENMSNTWSW